MWGSSSETHSLSCYFVIAPRFIVLRIRLSETGKGNLELASEETWSDRVSGVCVAVKGPQSQLWWSKSGSWTAGQGSFPNNGRVAGLTLLKLQYHPDAHSN